MTDLEGAWAASDIVDTTTGEVLLEANSEITADKVAKILESGVIEMSVFFPERDDVGTVISQTLRRDSITSPSEALIEIYRKLRPGDPPTLDTATALFQGMFFDPRKYDFSRVGRLKFNIKLFENQEATSLEQRTLDPDDFYATIKYLLKLRKNIGAVDDIDHLGNRRVRAVGELLENQFRIGLVRMERAIKEKMSVYQEMSTAMPHDLVNAKPVMAAIREFFGSSQLSQFMDQTNPLSEITHKRRLSALGPGGLSRERAGFEVRDVHPTHYGRICPIETPEGPNIGLISSLSCFARINDYGFIESPYRKVKGARVVDYVTGQPARVGFALGNEFSRSLMERRNYLDLAHSKLRPSSLGPELLVGELPDDVRGVSRIRRGKAVVGKSRSSRASTTCRTPSPTSRRIISSIRSSAAPATSTCISSARRRSPSATGQTQKGDVFEIEAEPFGLPLRNRLWAGKAEKVRIRAL